MALVSTGLRHVTSTLKHYNTHKVSGSSSFEIWPLKLHVFTVIQFTHASVGYSIAKCKFSNVQSFYQLSKLVSKYFKHLIFVLKTASTNH